MSSFPNPFRLGILATGLALAYAGLVSEPRAREATALAWPRIVTGGARMSKNAVCVAMVGAAAFAIGLTLGRFPGLGAFPVTVDPGTMSDLVATGLSVLSRNLVWTVAEFPTFAILGVFGHDGAFGPLWALSGLLRRDGCPGCARLLPVSIRNLETRRPRIPSGR